MSRMGSLLKSGAVFIAALALAPVSELQAAPLLPGSFQPAPGEADPVGGAVVATQTVPVVASTFTGSLTSTVIAGGANPLGGLTFTYQLTNTDPDASPTSIHRLTLSSFASFLADGSFQIPAVGVAPTSMDRSSGLGNDEVVGFNFFTPQLSPGQTTALLVVQTNAPAFTTGSAAVINSSADDSVGIYVPLPEPGALSLLGLAGVALVRRRR